MFLISMSLWACNSADVANSGASTATAGSPTATPVATASPVASVHKQYLASNVILNTTGSALHQNHMKDTTVLDTTTQINASDIVLDTTGTILTATSGTNNTNLQTAITNQIAPNIYNILVGTTTWSIAHKVWHRLGSNTIVTSQGIDNSSITFTDDGTNSGKGSISLTGCFLVIGSICEDASYYQSSVSTLSIEACVPISGSFKYEIISNTSMLVFYTRVPIGTTSATVAPLVLIQQVTSKSIILSGVGEVAVLTLQ